MKPISFSDVSTRKLALQSNCKREKISFRTVSNNLNTKNLLLFTESTYNDMDSHCKRSFLLYDRLLKESKVSDMDKRKIEHSLLSNLKKVSDIDSVYQTISSTEIDNKHLFFDSLEVLENCDRIIRNEIKLSKRFDMQKLIGDNIMRGGKHTVFELCSLLDTYSISSKAKMNIALENVIYALYKSGYNDVSVNEATEYIVEYFLTRDTVITDKQYNGYIDVLENNRFIDKDIAEISYVFEAKNTKGNSFTDKAKALVVQCETKECSAHMSQILKIKNEKQASDYIDKSIEMIIDEKVTINDSALLLKSIYCLPLIGNISKEFVNLKLEMSRSKYKIKQKLTKVQNQKLVRDVLDDGEMIDYVAFVSETVHFENYILDDAYSDEKNPVKLLESANSDDIKDIIKSFKASNEKSPSKFKNMISRIMTKSPENIIDDTPNIFAAVRIMLYLGVAASPIPLAPVFAAVIALVNKLLSLHLDLKQAEKLLKHLRSEKESAEKKLDKLSGQEKDNQKEYVECINKCIKKVEEFINDIDDENETVADGKDDDDFDFGDFNFESAILESGMFCSNPITKEILDLLKDSNIEILACISELFDNCTPVVANEFYNMVEQLEEGSSILENRGKYIIKENSFVVQYDALQTIKEILNEAKVNNNKNTKDKFNLATLKMAVINFKQKYKNLRGKEQEMWRNIDIATSQLSRGIQQALTSDRREAIIKGSIIPSFSKCIKAAITVASVGIITGNVVYAAIAAVGMLGASKALNERERRLIYDEIDTELQVVEKQIQLAENEGDMNQYRFLLNYQKKLIREKHRIKYGIHMSGRTIPEIKRGND